MPAGPARVGQPLAHLGSLVSGEVAQDDMHLLASGDLAVDQLEEADDVNSGEGGPTVAGD